MNRSIADYHMHSRISPDAHDEMRLMCQAAIDKGLKEICVTEHFEYYPKTRDKMCMDPALLDEYDEMLSICQREFEGRLVLRAGIEIGQHYYWPEHAHDILHVKHHYDYVIGSVHKPNKQGKDLGDVPYSAETLDAMCLEYIDGLYQMADKADFDCAGHLDLIKRYAAKSGFTVSLLDYKDEVAQVLRRIIERGKGLEINTSGLRQEVGLPMPSLDILKLYRELGGEILTVGSDAHFAKDIAANFDDARRLALSAGFDHLALYHERKPSFYPIA